MAYVQYKKDGWQKVVSIDDLSSGIFGRGDDCDFQILDPQISREHFRISRTNDGFFNIEDLGSSNGTYLNEEKLKSGSYRLENGDSVKVRDHIFVFWEMDEKGPPAPGLRVAGQETTRPGLRTTLLQQFGNISEKE